MCWFAFSGLTHIILEGYFVFTPDFFTFTKPHLLAEVCKFLISEAQVNHTYCERPQSPCQMLCFWCRNMFFLIYAQRFASGVLIYNCDWFGREGVQQGRFSLCWTWPHCCGDRGHHSSSCWSRLPSCSVCSLANLVDLFFFDITYTAWHYQYYSPSFDSTCNVNTSACYLLKLAIERGMHVTHC